MFRKFDNATGTSEFKILVVEQCRIMENTNMRSSGWIKRIGGEGHWVIGGKKVRFFSGK